MLNQLHPEHERLVPTYLAQAESLRWTSAQEITGSQPPTTIMLEEMSFKSGQSAWSHLASASYNLMTFAYVGRRRRVYTLPMCRLGTWEPVLSRCGLKLRFDGAEFLFARCWNGNWYHETVPSSEYSNKNSLCEGIDLHSSHKMRWEYHGVPRRHFCSEPCLGLRFSYHMQRKPDGGPRRGP